ncbi:DUF402 domain-containing protein [Streptomyces sp. NPDC005989]|uniref:DUF402 domain-containing protein n=1 Tax=Streptomyces sp. NPDC005989 TaxID=3156727 RepID=UPI0033CB07F6
MTAALRALAGTGEALVTACAPGAEARWPALHAKARDDGDRSVRTEAFDARATGLWELADAVWFSAFFVPDSGGGRRLWNRYVNYEHPTRRTEDGFDTFDLAVDLVVTPDLTRWGWKDEDEYAHERRLGIVSGAEYQAVDDAIETAVTSLDPGNCDDTGTGA